MAHKLKQVGLTSTVRQRTGCDRDPLRNALLATVTNGSPSNTLSGPSGPLPPTRNSLHLTRFAGSCSPRCLPLPTPRQLPGLPRHRLHHLPVLPLIFFFFNNPPPPTISPFPLQTSFPI